VLVVLEEILSRELRDDLNIPLVLAMIDQLVVVAVSEVVEILVDIGLVGIATETLCEDNSPSTKPDFSVTERPAAATED
jgi:hypothetical protein